MGKKSKTPEIEAEDVPLDESQTQVDEDSQKLSYEEEVLRALPIAQPMASRKLAKKAFKVCKFL